MAPMGVGIQLVDFSGLNGFKLGYIKREWAIGALIRGGIEVARTETKP